MLIDLGALAADQGFKIQGDNPFDYAGYSVSSAGDVNGDGFDDFIVGAPRNDSGGTDSGAAYVIFGKASGLGPIDFATLTEAQGFKIQGHLNNDRLGASVSSAGDFNNDGFDDLIVGAPFNSGGGAVAGAAYLIFGKASAFGVIDVGELTATQGFKITGDIASDNAGYSVSGAGDINGDGFDDLIVGARGNDSGGTDAGAAYIIFGRDSDIGPIDLGTPLTPAQGFKIQGDAIRDYAGISVAGGGDLNGDGFADLVIGAFRNDTGGTDAGAAYVIFGKAAPFDTIDLETPLTAAQGFKILGENDIDRAGNSVANAGDVNGDGFDDLIVGGFRNRGATGQTSGEAGAAYVIFGKAEGFGTIDLEALTAAQGFKIQGETVNDRAGRSVSGGGDVNGDGFDDVIVGAPYADGGGNSSGSAYVIFGKASGFGTISLATLTASQGFEIQGDANYDQAGFSVSVAGDVNGDGADDLLVGARGNDSGGDRSGAAYIIYGIVPGRTLFGDEDPNILEGGGGPDSIFGRGGNDTLRGLGGNDRLFGEAGDDTLEGGAGNDNLQGGGDNDTVNGGAGDDNVNGGTGNDSLNGDDGDDSVVGADGDDVLTGGAGIDILKGGIGNDIYVVEDADTIIELVDEGIDEVGATQAFYILPANIEELVHLGTLAIDYRGNDIGNDIDAGTAASATLFGFGGDDLLTGTEANDKLYGGIGGDTLNGLGGVDILIGEDGDDTVNGGAGNDNVQGGGDNDRVNGGADNDNVNGGGGDDMLFGDDGNDSVVGGTGNDRLDGGAGNDIMVGGDGIDIFIVDSASDTVIELEGGVDNGSDRVITAFASYTLPANVEIFEYAGTAAINIAGNAGDNIFFSNGAASAVFSGFGGNDTLNGTDNADTFFGGIGNDTLNGNGGNDVLLGEANVDFLYGGDGNDNLQGGGGTDLLDGGSGNDNLIGQGDNDELFGGDGNDSLSGNDGGDTVSGGSGDDLLFGNEGIDLIIGGDGDDRLAGGTEDDILDGGQGADILNGEAGDDLLNGEGGDDRLFDSAGIDSLTGGLGADDFRFTTSANADGDTVTDFASGIDKLNFRVFDTDAGTAGVQNPGFSFIGAAAFNADGSAKLRFENGLLQGDVDGNGTVDFTIEIGGDAPLPSDFLL